jgi:Type II CAAX prenyl endopeptidase Rce1-like
MNLYDLKTFSYLFLGVVIIVVILMTVVRYLFEKLISYIFKRIHQERTSTTIFIRAIILIIFNLIVLKMFGFLESQLFSFNKPKTGLLIIAAGIGITILVDVLSRMALKAGYGSGYNTLASTSKLDIGLTVATFALLAGPSEDIFFIGFIQNALTPALGWFAIICYLLIFVGYHYANVLSGVETKMEFLGTLPIRLLVSSLLGISFFLTGTIMWGMIVHNLVDTSSYLILLRNKPVETSPSSSTPGDEK